MILVGLTGGIGSGKTTVSEMLAARGAIIVDADQIVRDVQRPGSPVLIALAEAFGDQVIDANGELDRNALGIPSERYGFTNNARGITGPPNFEDAVVEIGDKPIEISIR